MISTGARLRVRACADGSAVDVAAGIRLALGMLQDAGRIELVGAYDPADIVHTVGFVDGAARRAAHRVHTIHRIPLRSGRVTPEGCWLRNERRHARDVSGWFAHGQTAGRMLVESGLARSATVYGLPLLPPVWCMAIGASCLSAAARAAIRDQLAVAPGVRLVLGVDAPTDGRRSVGWGPVLMNSGRLDVAVAAIHPVDGDPEHRYRVRSTTGLWSTQPYPLAELLSAADLFVATGHELEVHSAAVAAVVCGLPVIAVTTDSVAELVLSGARGYVVAPHPTAVARAVTAQIDGGLPPRRTGAPLRPEPNRIAGLARALLLAYRGVLRSAMVSGAA
ncbi:MAG: glycosyltransferase [Actinomycetota bacterium]|nr:glycosyltransferase [Actinomycetota bacterium]